MLEFPDAKHGYVNALKVLSNIIKQIAALLIERGEISSVDFANLLKEHGYKIRIDDYDF